VKLRIKNSNKYIRACLIEINHTFFYQTNIITHLLLLRLSSFFEYLNAKNKYIQDINNTCNRKNIQYNSTSVQSFKKILLSKKKGNTKKF
jgi:hypothetical protein